MAVRQLAEKPVTGQQVAASAPPKLTFSQRFQRYRYRGRLASLVLIVPLLFTFGYFAWWPIGRGLVLSFQQTNLLESSWVGWENFKFVLTDPLLPQVIENTLLFAFLGVLFGFPLPLAAAVLISELKRGKVMFSTLAYLPVMIPPVVAILLWKVFYAPGENGVLNALLGLVGLGPYPWLDSASFVIPSMVLQLTWAGFGNATVIFIAALAGVNRQLYEAAELDGAGIWQRVWHVTLPQIRKIVLILLLLDIIGTMQVFNQPRLFTGGGPNNSSMTILMLIYRYGFEHSNFGAAAALSIMLALVLIVISAVYQFATRRLSHDD